MDEEAAIRANTTILLGNLSNHLSEPACKRVLLNAFTRALKDSFPPARIAGLKVRAFCCMLGICCPALASCIYTSHACLLSLAPDRDLMMQLARQ